MALIFLAVTALVSLNFCSGSESWPELNPQLEQYQDLSKCFPLPETWHVVYRNYESDPVFGGTAKCVKFTETGPPANGAYPVLIEYEGQSMSTTATLESSSGYTGKNILKFTPLTRGKHARNTYAAYAECNECAVLRTTYISDSTCALLVPESQLKQNTTCCDFIFDLLCGTTPKYYIYDESC
ncbi:uncharacterized protein LOC115332040 [Ixodes scapularis]|uniref:uncharacterized protein LOC115332040 n=1 Tax=Ixodes scapularis TaxID=6945 RepID=UPI001A9EC346|nr:uncharacterized protein LOC115332040 [Ixodes scapularis]